MSKVAEILSEAGKSSTYSKIAEMSSLVKMQMESDILPECKFVAKISGFLLCWSVETAKRNILQHLHEIC